MIPWELGIILHWTPPVTKATTNREWPTHPTPTTTPWSQTQMPQWLMDTGWIPMSEATHTTLWLDTRVNKTDGRDQILVHITTIGRRSTSQHTAHVPLSKGPFAPTPTKYISWGYSTTATDKKSQLRQKLGDPNHKEKWLEGLAIAQTAEWNASVIYYKQRNKDYMLSRSIEWTKWPSYLAVYWQSVW